MLQAQPWSQERREEGKDVKSITWPSPCSTAGSLLPKSEIKKLKKKKKRYQKAELDSLSNQLKVWLLGLTGFGRSETCSRYSFQQSYILMSKEQVICRKVLREIRHLTENSWEGGNWERMIYKCRLSGFIYKKHWDTSVCRCFGFRAGFCDSKDKTKQNEHFIITQCYGSTRRCIFQRFSIHFLGTK